MLAYACIRKEQTKLKSPKTELGELETTLHFTNDQYWHQLIFKYYCTQNVGNKPFVIVLRFAFWCNMYEDVDNKAS